MRPSCTRRSLPKLSHLSSVQLPNSSASQSGSPMRRAMKEPSPPLSSLGPSRLLIFFSLCLTLFPPECTASRNSGVDGGKSGGGGSRNEGESPLRPLVRLWENAQDYVRSENLQNMREGLAKGVRLQQTDDFEGFAHIGIRADRFGRGTSETTENAERVQAEGEMRRSNSGGEGVRSWRDYFPRIRYHFEPSTTLKLRKRFYPLKTRLTLGADYNTQLGLWQFMSSWEDQIIGGRFSFRGRELQLSKKWMLKLDEASDLVAKLSFRAALDTSTGATYAKFGWRFEKLQPLNVRDGIPWRQKLPLDGPEGHVKLEVRAKFALPEPDIEYSSTKDSEGSMIVGMGDIDVRVEELNLLMEY